MGYLIQKGPGHQLVPRNWGLVVADGLPPSALEERSPSPKP